MAVLFVLGMLLIVMLLAMTKSRRARRSPFTTSTDGSDVGYAAGWSSDRRSGADGPDRSDSGGDGGGDGGGGGD